MLTTIRSKLLAAFVATALGASAVAVTALSGFSQLGALSEEVFTNLIPSLGILDRLHDAMLEVELQTHGALIAAYAKDPARIEAARAARVAAWATLEKEKGIWEAIPMKEEESRRWAEYVEKLRAWRPISDAAMSHIEAGDLARALEQSGRADQAEAAMMVPFERVVAIQAELAARWEREGKEAGSSVRAWMIAVSLVAIIAALVLGLYMTLSITRPLAKVTAAAEAIADGDVDQAIDHHSRDELGQLSESFRKLVGYVKGVAEAAHGLSRGDLSVELKPRSPADVLSRNFQSARDALSGLLQETRMLISAAQQGDLRRRGDAQRFQGAYGDLVSGFNKVMEAIVVPVSEASAVLEQVAARDLTARMKGEYEGEYAKIKRSLNTAVENLHDGLSSVSIAVEQVASASGQIASSSQAVAQGASEQARSLEETSSSLGEMAGMTKANAASAARANDLANEAKAASGAGSDAMHEMTSAMEKIRGSAEGTAAIIRDINEIAFQTNLLALNAAVEAARAGEAGRGFAVVAEEVRNLALRSKEAAKKTESLISDSVALAKHGEGVSKQVSVNLTGIVGAVTKVTEIIHDIATSSGAQSRGIEQVVKAVGQMDQVTQQNAASSEQSSSAAQELSGQTQEMTVLVGQFKLDRKQAPITPRGRARPAPIVFQRDDNATRKHANGTNGTNGKNGHAAALIPFDDDPVFKDF